MQKCTAQSIRKIFTFFLAFTTFYFLQAQNENRLVHPLFTDEFKTYQILPDETIRIITISDQNNGYGGNHPFYLDITTGSLNDIPEPISLEIPGHWFNSYTNEFSSIGLKGGDIILANTQFDCDYEPPGGLMRLDRDGSIRWYIDFIENEIYASPDGMVFIDANSILIKDYWDPEEHMIIDREGNILTKSLPDTVYDLTVETEFGFLAGTEQRLDVLDTNFNVVISFELGNSVNRIQDIGYDRYLIKTGSKIFIFRDQSVLEELPLSPTQLDVIGYSESYWAVNDHSQFIQLDTFFVPMDTFELSPGVEPVICLPMSDGLLGIAKYRGARTALFKADEEDMNFSLPQDIGITGITIPDTVYFQPAHNYPWGIEFHIDSLAVDVTNFGEDTIRKFTIVLPSFWSCFWCSGHDALWHVDSLITPPGETRYVFLGMYYSDCIEGGGPTWNICLSTISPNNKADGNFQNDTICRRFSFLISGTENILPDNSVRIRPVPATDFIYLDLDKSINQKLFGIIYDVTGKRLQNIEVSTGHEKISVADLDSGLYFINIYNSEGMRATKKFLVQH